MKRFKLLAALLPVVMLTGNIPVNAGDDTVVLRVCNWEEYVDEGGWEEDEVIELESGDIFGEAALYEEFEDWYYENYGQKVKVEYSCFGTNEELYNMLTLGDVYDLVIPSEYMFMKLLEEDMLVPYSADFFDEEDENNYYIRNVSPFIRDTFESNEIEGHHWNEYAAGYMWGVTGILYNAEEVSKEDAQTWRILDNPAYFRQITVKDNVRDTYFAALGAIKSEELLDPSFINDPAYHDKLAAEMNDVSPETIEKSLDYLQKVRDNVYSFETDSGKADMVTGKVLANYQWSGDAVYAMDQAEEEDDVCLSFAVPDECTNLWFDAMVMLKKGISEDPRKQAAAEAYVNFMSRPDNAVRNMYYIGYTSSISGGPDGDQVFEYMDYMYGAEEDEEDVVDYDVSYFFGERDGEPASICAPAEQMDRQLFAQYPTEDVMNRSSLMFYFDAKANADINRMWVGVRCFNIKNVPVYCWVILALAAAGVIFLVIRKKKNER